MLSDMIRCTVWNLPCITDFFFFFNTVSSSNFKHRPSFNQIKSCYSKTLLDIPEGTHGLKLPILFRVSRLQTEQLYYLNYNKVSQNYFLLLISWILFPDHCDVCLYLMCKSEYERHAFPSRMARGLLLALTLPVMYY